MTTPKPSDMPGAVLPYGYGARLSIAGAPLTTGTDLGTTSVASVPLPSDRCGRVIGAAHDRCTRRAGHGGGCRWLRRDDLDVDEDSADVAPSPPPFARLNGDQRHDVAVALEVASRAARMSSMTKVLSARERELAEQLHDEIVARLFRNVRLSSSGPGVTSPTPGPDTTP